MGFWFLGFRGLCGYMKGLIGATTRVASRRSRFEGSLVVRMYRQGLRIYRFRCFSVSFVGFGV